MKFEIYQTDNSNIIFMPFKEEMKKSFSLDRYGYQKVFEGECQLSTNPYITLEEIFTRFNRDDRPNPTTMRSLSISDIVILDGRTYYCDSIGFKEISMTIKKRCRRYGNKQR